MIIVNSLIAFDMTVLNTQLTVDNHKIIVFIHEL